MGLKLEYFNFIQTFTTVIIIVVLITTADVVFFLPMIGFTELMDWNSSSCICHNQNIHTFNVKRCLGTIWLNLHFISNTFCKYHSIKTTHYIANSFHEFSTSSIPSKKKYSPAETSMLPIWSSYCFLPWWISLEDGVMFFFPNI